MECLLNPCLKGYCVAVTGDQDMRHGIVLAKSNEAKAMGVKTAEAIWQARKKCPDLICVPPHYNAYVEYSKKVKEIYSRYSDRVEAFSLDECWIDVTDTLPLLGKDGKQTADEIRETVKKETGLTISVGVSFTKSFAKLGSDMKKPDATTVITKENFRKTVWNLDVADMIMIGRKTAEKLISYDVYETDEKNGRTISLKKYYYNIDDPVIENRNVPMTSVEYEYFSGADRFLPQTADIPRPSGRL